MIGFIVGAITVYGLFTVFGPRSWRRHDGMMGYHHRLHGHCGQRRHSMGGMGGWRHEPEGPKDYEDYEDQQGGRARGRGRKGAWMIKRLASRINATPDQAEVLHTEAQEFFGQMKELRGELKGTRRDIAQAMQHPLFDETVMGESFARQDEQLLEARKRLIGGLVRVHDVLEPEQREHLAKLIKRGPGFREAREAREANAAW